ncbi:MAG: amidohydrolase [Anaerovoracaceae bacterium]
MFNPVDFRRELHKYAEQSWHEVRTSARIAEELSKMGYEPLVGGNAVCVDAIGPMARLSDEERLADMQRAVEQGADKGWVEKANGIAGVAAILDTGRPGPVVAFRADIDALPYCEKTEAGDAAEKYGYKSVNEAAHACGHDGHAAIVLGLAERLMTQKDSLKGKIKFLFQPAEEAYFGADSMVAKGHLDDVDVLVTMHLAISGDNKPLPSGTLALGCDDFLSHKRLDVEFIGRAAHPCGAAQEGRNAILAACAATLGIHSIAPHEDGLFRVNVGLISGGIAINTIAPNATICLEYRGETEAIETYAAQRVDNILKGAAEMYGCQLKITDYGNTVTAKSDRSLMELIRETAEEEGLFTRRIFEIGNVGGSDDATVMMRCVQSHGGVATYMGIGADITHPLHNEAFDFDEASLEEAILLCENITRKAEKLEKYYSQK